MNRHSIQFGARESTASARQHASRLPVDASVLQSDPSPASEGTINGTPKPPPRFNESLELLLREPDKGATGEATSVGVRATESPGQSDVQRQTALGIRLLAPQRWSLPLWPPCLVL